MCLPISLKFLNGNEAKVAEKVLLIVIRMLAKL